MSPQEGRLQHIGCELFEADSLRAKFQLPRVVPYHAHFLVREPLGRLGLDLQRQSHFGTRRPLQCITTAFRIASNAFTGRVMSISTEP